jgi:hypothetical protein
MRQLLLMQPGRQEMCRWGWATKDKTMNLNADYIGEDAASNRRTQLGCPGRSLQRERGLLAPGCRGTAPLRAGSQCRRCCRRARSPVAPKIVGNCFTSREGDDAFGRENDGVGHAGQVRLRDVPPDLKEARGSMKTRNLLPTLVR